MQCLLLQRSELIVCRSHRKYDPAQLGYPEVTSSILVEGNYFD
jgi:hypothetical protein